MIKEFILNDRAKQKVSRTKDSRDFMLYMIANLDLHYLNFPFGVEGVFSGPCLSSFIKPMIDNK